MTVTVIFECGGCFKKTDGTTWLKREFTSFSGRGYGLGTYREMRASEVAPQGWVAFDPYTGCCYCPECWALIESGDEATA